MKRLLFGAGGVASFAAAAVLIAAGPATASTSPSVQSGWWNEASAGAVAAPSTTPSDELQVSNGLKGPLAFAAVRFTAPSAPQISLTLAIPSGSSSVGTPAVSACPTTSSWKAGADQSAASAPGYDCTGKQADGKASGSSEQWLIPASWASKGVISVALVPTPGTQAPFAQSFADPTASSIAGVQTSSQTPTTVSPAPAGASPAPAPVAVSPPASAAPAVPASPASPSIAASQAASALPPSLGPVGVSPSSPASAAPASAAPSRPASAPTQQAPGGGTTAKPASNRPARIMALVILLATGAALFFLAGRPQRPPRKLGSLAAHTDTGTQVVVQPAMGGIGRFARPRIGPPKRI